MCTLRQSLGMRWLGGQKVKIKVTRSYRHGRMAASGCCSSYATAAGVWLHVVWLLRFLVLIWCSVTASTQGVGVVADVRGSRQNRTGQAVFLQPHAALPCRDCVAEECSRCPLPAVLEVCRSVSRCRFLLSANRPIPRRCVINVSGVLQLHQTDRHRQTLV